MSIRRAIVYNNYERTPRITCYTLWDTWWYVFPDNTVARMDSDSPWIKTWQHLHDWEQVPFLYY